MGTSLGKGDGNHGSGSAYRMRGSMQKKGVFPFCRIFGTAKKQPARLTRADCRPDQRLLSSVTFLLLAQLLIVVAGRALVHLEHVDGVIIVGEPALTSHIIVALLTIVDEGL